MNHKNGFSADTLAIYKWPVSVSRGFKVTPAQVWHIISQPENLKDYHPFCEQNPVEKWPGVGSKDAVHYYSGWIYQRQFTKWFKGSGYDLLIGREGGRKSYVSWRIWKEQDDIAMLNITIYPHALQNIPVAFRWIPHLTTIRPALHKYLDAVLSGLGWFINTGKPVTKDQFGAHKWFSDKND